MANKRRCICMVRPDPTCKAHGHEPSPEWSLWNDDDDAAMQEAWLTMHDEDDQRDPQTWRQWLLGESDGDDEAWTHVLGQAVGYGFLLLVVIVILAVLMP